MCCDVFVSRDPNDDVSMRLLVSIGWSRSLSETRAAWRDGLLMGWMDLSMSTNKHVVDGMLAGDVPACGTGLWSMKV